MVKMTFTYLLYGLLALTLVGCQGGSSPTAPASESDVAEKPTRLPGTVALGHPQMQGDAALIPAAMWDVTIDVATLTPSVGKRPDERTGQTYAETYLMDVTRYFTPSVMEIEGVTRTAPGRIKVDYTIAHPFAAATAPDAPASATNRADLGITGIVMFPLDVTDETPITYFADTARPIIANTDAIATADGYYVPAGLIYGLDMQANCFPFRRLVNDSRIESRIGIRLDKPGVGNFDPNFGWQRSNWGPSQTGWTGYGALHQGQVARNSVELNLPVDPITSISLPVMLIAKYLDPVGTGSSPADRAANRLPTADGDRTKFLYRMPQAAWDLERVEVRVDGEFARLGESEVTLQVRVTDWDAKALATPLANLRDELSAGLVEAGEAGWPEFAVSVPTLESMTPVDSTVIAGVNVRVNNDVEIGGDPEPDSGGAEDPLFFRIPLTDSSPTHRFYREHRGLLRVRDVASASGSLNPLSPWLAPLTADAPGVESFQTFEVVVDGVVPALLATLAKSPVLSGTAPQLDIQILTPGYSLEGSMIIDWNGDGDYADETESLIREMTVLPVRYTAPEKLLNPTAEWLPRSIQIRWWTDTFEEAHTETIDYFVDSNRPPTAPTTGSMAPSFYMLEAQRLASPASFNWSEYPRSMTDPEGDPISFAVRRVDTGEVLTSDILPMAMHALPITAPPDTFVPFELYLCDPLHPGAEGTLIWSQTLRIDGGSPSGWSRMLPVGAAYSETGDLCLDAEGNSYVMGRLSADFDFGDGLHLAMSAYVVSYSPTGAFRWAKSFPSESSSGGGAFFVSGAVDASGRLILGAAAFDATDFGGGLTPKPSICVVVLDADDGNYLWQRAWIVPAINKGPHLMLSADGSVTLAGALENGGTYSFGGPSRQTAIDSSSPYVLRLTQSGDYRWDYSATGAWTTTWEIDEDVLGQLYLSGIHNGEADYGAGRQASTIPVPWLLSLAADGSFQWSKVLSDSPGTGGFYAVAGSHTTSGCLVSGDFSQAIDLGSGSASSGAGGFWLRYDSDGEWLWERRYVGGALDIDCHADGDFFIAGQFINVVILMQIPIASEGFLDAYLVRTTDSGIVRWSSLWQGKDQNGTTEVAVIGDWVSVLAAHAGLIDLDASEGQYFTTPPLSMFDAEQSFLLTVRADTGQW